MHMSSHRQEDIPRSEIIPFSNTIEEADGRAYDLTALIFCTKENETGIYYLTLFAQNSIGEGNESNTVTYAYQCKLLTYIPYYMNIQLLHQAHTQ